MLIVTASHAHADYDSLMNACSFACTFAGDEKTDSYVSCVGGKYYAAVPLLGCGKDADTAEAAIRSLLAENGYTDIQIAEPAPEPTPPSGKPLAKSLHTVTVLVRVARLIQATDSSGYSNHWAIDKALAALGLAGMPDTYGLAAAALKQLDKGN